MEPMVHRRDAAHDAHLEEARRVLTLPLAVSGLRWHPFGLYTAPLARRERDGSTWSRRLHIWHPDAKPVGEASAYGVHTHTGPAESHVLVGSLRHHLYDFAAGDGAWDCRPLGADARSARLVAHVSAVTRHGTTHALPAHQPHGVSKDAPFAISLFEQRDDATDRATPFTTWRRTDVPAEELVRTPPVPVATVLQEARAALDEALLWA